MLVFVSGRLFPVFPVFPCRCIAAPRHIPKINAASHIQRGLYTNRHQVFQDNTQPFAEQRGKFSVFCDIPRVFRVEKLLQHKAFTTAG